VKLEKKIILKLIHKYEKSKSFHEESQRKVALNASNLDDYLKSADEKSRYHDVIKTLYKKGFVDIEWEHLEEDNLLKRLILNLDALEEIYEAYHYKSKFVRLREAVEDLDSLPCLGITNELKKEVNVFLNKGKFHKYWPDDREKRLDLIKVFSNLQSIDEMTERLFSIKCFGDSKYFEKKVKSRLLSIIRTYDKLDLEDNEILEGLGITQNPNEILLCGQLKIKLDDWIDLSCFPYGTSINKETIHHIDALKVEANRIVTIENKAVYYEYIRDKKETELVIYLGGFFGRSTRKFISLLNNVIENIEFFHLSDVDLGGFRIFDYLNHQLSLEVIPLHMGVEDLEKKDLYAQAFNQSYEKKLKDYLEKYPKSVFKDVIEIILEKKIRLEQEAFYI